LEFETLFTLQSFCWFSGNPLTLVKEFDGCRDGVNFDEERVIFGATLKVNRGDGLKEFSTLKLLLNFVG